ncbi:MAG: ribbon-helix-helix protein, CopG family [Chloroflexi bacterium]|nr:ribbon-helix-helix protein, CopG family [Chloroflexota bacterium]
MGKSTITITMDDALLETVDRLVEKSVYPDRSLAIQEAVKDKFKRSDKSLLERELAKMDPEFEQRMADEFLPRDLSEWPEY